MCDAASEKPDVCLYQHKVRHPSRRLAVEAMKVQLLKILHQKGHDKPVMDVYRCPGCDGWHVGNNDVEKLRQIRRCGRKRPEPQVGDFEDET
jgi:hypothetical protein